MGGAGEALLFPLPRWEGLGESSDPGAAPPYSPATARIEACHGMKKCSTTTITR